MGSNYPKMKLFNFEKNFTDQEWLFLLPKHRLGLPANYVFSLPAEINSGSKYPNKEYFISEHRGTGDQ